MADSDRSGQQGNKELSTENRLLLAFVLMGIVLFATPYFFKAPPPPPGKKVQLAPAPVTTTEQKPAEAVPTAPAPGQVSASKESILTLDTDCYHIAFSNRGAVVQRWIVKKYQASNHKPVDLLNSAAALVA